MLRKETYMAISLLAYRDKKVKSTGKKIKKRQIFLEGVRAKPV